MAPSVNVSVDDGYGCAGWGLTPVTAMANGLAYSET